MCSKWPMYFPNWDSPKTTGCCCFHLQILKSLSEWDTLFFFSSKFLEEEQIQYMYIFYYLFVLLIIAATTPAITTAANFCFYSWTKTCQSEVLSRVHSFEFVTRSECKKSTSPHPSELIKHLALKSCLTAILALSVAKELSNQHLPTHQIYQHLN